MDNKFTEKLQNWLLTEESERDYDQGAIMLLQLTGNKIMYRSISVNPRGKKEFIVGKLQQYLNFRLAAVTHEEVQEMQQEVEVIVEKDVKPDVEAIKAGKRTDHDKLPEEVKQCYVDNLQILHRMRELHLQLRKLSTVGTTCPDSERYPFLKELIRLDKLYRHNWDVYDHFIIKDETE